ncbi:MAG: peptidylprolyl isomerase [Gammaproteobacteria bacterium]|nr:peptidylprolyl isomerase [Gammaproteobacteria bacterium]
MKKQILVAAILFATLTANSLYAEDTLIDKVVAVVNDDVILQSEVERETQLLTRQASEAGQRLPEAEILRERILERLIQNKVQMQRAENLGISVDEDSLNRAINSIARNNNMDLSRFRQALREEGLDYQVFRQNIREEMTIARLRNREVEANVNVSAREIDAYLKRTTGQDAAQSSYKLQHILIGVPEGASSEQIRQASNKIEAIRKSLSDGGDFAQIAAANSDGARALDGGEIGWRRPQELPELFAEAIMQLGPGEISPPLRSPNGFHLLKVQEIKDDSASTVTETKARHILLKETATRDSDASRALLQQIRQRLTDGESFASLAQEFSDDPNSASQGGELPWYKPGEMIPEFEQVAQSLPTGQVSEPFRSSFGWHLVETLERRAVDPSQKNQRAEAEATLRKTRADEEYELWLRRLRADAYVEIRDAG